MKKPELFKKVAEHIPRIETELATWEVPSLMDTTPSRVYGERRERLERYLASGALLDDLMSSRRPAEIDAESGSVPPLDIK